MAEPGSGDRISNDSFEANVAGGTETIAFTALARLYDIVRPEDFARALSVAAQRIDYEIGIQSLERSVANKRAWYDLIFSFFEKRYGTRAPDVFVTAFFLDSPFLNATDRDRCVAVLQERFPGSDAHIAGIAETASRPRNSQEAADGIIATIQRIAQAGGTETTVVTSRLTAEIRALVISGLRPEIEATFHDLSQPAHGGVLITSIEFNIPVGRAKELERQGDIVLLNYFKNRIALSSSFPEPSFPDAARLGRVNSLLEAQTGYRADVTKDPRPGETRYSFHAVSKAALSRKITRRTGATHAESREHDQMEAMVSNLSPENMDLFLTTLKRGDFMEWVFDNIQKTARVTNLLDTLLSKEEVFKKLNLTILFQDFGILKKVANNLAAGPIENQIATANMQKLKFGRISNPYDN